MQIGELADASGVPAKTIRYYEEVGLLPAAARSPNGYRTYGASDAERLGFIRSARELGFSIAELRTVLAIRDGGTAPCHHVLDLLGEKLVSLDEQMRRLAELRAELQQLQEAGSSLPTDDVRMERCVCQLIRSR